MHSLSLAHETGGFLDWHAAMNDDKTKNGLTHVIIHSAPKNTNEGRDYRKWQAWEKQGIYPEFTDAIDRIKELKHLTSVKLAFSDSCCGVQNDSRHAASDAESIKVRLHTLQAVFQAMHHRTQDNPDFDCIRSLTIENLQNAPLPEFTTSVPFKSVMRDIQELRLSIATEYNEYGPDHDLGRIERVEFEPYFREHWIAPIAKQLTSLSLLFNECWGTAPGYFDGRVLAFPQLKTLNLGNFVISHHDHFDWVLQQTSLTHLRLDCCYIASFLNFDEFEINEWKMPRHDWQRLPDDSFGFDGGYTYSFSGTWAQIFDKICSSLPHLEDFRTGHSDNPTLESIETMASGLHERRYICLQTGLLPSPWILALNDGCMGDFGYLFEKEYELDSGHEAYDPDDNGLNKAKEHEVTDGAALGRLQDLIAERKAS